MHDSIDDANLPRTEITTSKTAIASFVLGLATAILLGILTAIPAIVLGHIALLEIGHQPDKYKGKALAITGLTLGYISVALFLLLNVIGLTHSKGVSFAPFHYDLF